MQTIIGEEDSILNYTGYKNNLTLLNNFLNPLEGESGKDCGWHELIP